MKTHVTVLAIIHLILGLLALVPAILVLVLAGGLTGVVALVAGTSPDAEAAIAATGIALGALAVFLSFILAVLSVPSILAGWGLLKQRSWARILTLILSGLHLFNIPIGTALGGYGLWVLLSSEGRALFDRHGVPELVDSATLARS